MTLWCGVVADSPPRRSCCPGLGRGHRGVVGDRGHLHGGLHVAAGAALEVGDRVQFDQECVFNPPPGTYSIVQIEDGLQRQINAARMVASNNLDNNTYTLPPKYY